MISRHPLPWWAAPVFFATLVLPIDTAKVAAQPPRTGSDTLLFLLDSVAATATRTPREIFLTPAPVSVIDARRLRETHANTIVDLFRDLPGLGVTGVGVQQPRPIIRGQRGQRILLLQDGTRLNSSRRQQDFGELPALVEQSSVERVEIVRGPASVLYGTDAIGGVVNLITRVPERDGVHGTIGYRYGDVEEQHRGSASILARQGAFDLALNASVREAESYRAPAGSFGNITLDDDAVVNGTGVRDRGASVRLGYHLTPMQRVFVRGEYYRAEDAGFGYVSPEAYDPGGARIDIQYPHQRFQKFTAGWTATTLGTPIADGVDVIAWTQDNERNLNFDLFTSFGPQAPPGAGIAVQTFNFTDLSTIGLRAEARKAVSDQVLLTYGVDFFRDRTENTDSSVTTLIGFGPPQVETDNRALVPNATYRSIGAFLQGEVQPSSRLTVILGGRVQGIRAETDDTPGLTETFETKDDRTVVGAANALFVVTENVTLVGSVGRAFRAPNLIEWLFDGPTPEGNGYQVRSLDLDPETSVNVDVGVRVRSRHAALEVFAFRNVVKNGIRIAPLDSMAGGLPAFHNVNVEELLFRGVEASAEVRLPYNLGATGAYTWLDTEDRLDPSNPIGDAATSSLSATLRYHRSDRLWAEYAVRHVGERDDILLDDNPVGDVLPAFTVHHVRLGVTVLRRAGHSHRIGIMVNNLTNELYAESSNASFFRPEPRRGVTLTYDLVF
jgi:hemoglobin/transferrin/lactoferrin receptor protein